MNLFALFALSAGIAVAVQATLNARLGVLLKSSMLATGIAFLLSFVFTISAVILSTHQYPQLSEIKAVPIYLWFTGGVLSAFGVGIFYYLIPKMGIGPVMSYALSGQILVAVIASHFGWFELPVKPMNSLKFLGLVSLIGGVFLINGDFNNAH